MKIYELKRTQFLPASMEEAWDFFSSPLNLNAMTPPSLKFRIESVDSYKMYSGQIIIYKIKILPGFVSTWVTEITEVKAMEYFIDEQRFGPYKFWHHKHFFKEAPGGIEMTDIVHYALPFGPLGRAVHALFVKNRLKEIFSFRYNFLKDKF